MKATINGKRYNTDNCEILAKSHHYNNGKYTGTTYLLMAKNGDYLVHADTNGQDLFSYDYLRKIEKENITKFLNGADIDDDQEKRCVELGLIEII